MPVTSKWVHGGVFLAAAVLVLSITVLILGAARRGPSDAGLPGSVAPPFTLKDMTGRVTSSVMLKDNVTVLIFGNRRDTHFDKAADIVNGLVRTYAADDTVKFIGMQYDTEQSILGRDDHAPGAVETKLENVNVILDNEAAAARAYRVNDEPTAFVVDRKGIIRGRVTLANESARVLCNEAINTLRNSDQPLGGR